MRLNEYESTESHLKLYWINGHRGNTDACNRVIQSKYKKEKLNILLTTKQYPTRHR